MMPVERPTCLCRRFQRYNDKFAKLLEILMEAIIKAFGIWENVHKNRQIENGDYDAPIYLSKYSMISEVHSKYF